MREETMVLIKSNASAFPGAKEVYLVFGLISWLSSLMKRLRPCSHQRWKIRVCNWVKIKVFLQFNVVTEFFFSAAIPQLKLIYDPIIVSTFLLCLWQRQPNDISRDPWNQWTFWWICSSAPLIPHAYYFKLESVTSSPPINDLDVSSIRRSSC